MYPLLTEMIKTLASDNGGLDHLKLERDWEWPDNAERLETLASRLTEYERETMVCGEEQEMKNLVRQHGIQELEQFVRDIFDDGPLVPNFYYM